jgi:hypothetical protein
MFTFENSGNQSGAAPPYRDITDEDLAMVEIKGEYGAAEQYTVVGYTESPPFHARGYESIAIMFEDTQTFEQTWWHGMSTWQSRART